MPKIRPSPDGRFLFFGVRMKSVPHSGASNPPLKGIIPVATKENRWLLRKPCGYAIYRISKADKSRSREKKITPTGNRMMQIRLKGSFFVSMQQKQWSDQDLVQGVLRQSAPHQVALYERYSTPMFRVLLRYARDRSEAEDMLQDGFIRVYRDMNQFRGEGALGGWVRRIMVNTALSHLRKQRDFIRDVADYMPFENQLRTDEDFSARIDAELLMRLLQELPPGYRAVFNLYAIDGFSHEEIAEQLGITVGTSKSQLFKARDFLKKILAKSYFEPKHD
jgi:RNA polymerase sigma factor (sigma-70 family)